jgi:CheY-like chemotaxis protein
VFHYEPPPLLSLAQPTACLARPPHSPGPHAITTVPKGKEKAIRLMLVEDCRLVRVGIRAILDEEPSFNVVAEVDSGESALAILDAQQPDIMLIDLGLPGISGIELMQQVRAKYPKTKSIILTSHESEEEILSALSGGANAYCIKKHLSSPFGASRLLGI